MQVTFPQELTGVQALCYCRCVYEVASAQVADNMLVEVFDFQFHFLL